jgi:hypothetical protein
MANYNFPPTSRYYGVEIAKLAEADGEQTPYLRRRFLPDSRRFALLREHVVTDGERMDLIAARELGDAEAFWRICDANDAMRPEDLALVNRRLRITLPEGIPGMPSQ